MCQQNTELRGHPHRKYTGVPYNWTVYVGIEHYNESKLTIVRRVLL